MLKKNLKNDLTISKETDSILDSLSFLISERKRQGISQLDFSQKIGMSQAQLSKIESLSSVPSLKTLRRYAHGVGLMVEIDFVPESSYMKN